MRIASDIANLHVTHRYEVLHQEAGGSRRQANAVPRKDRYDRVVNSAQRVEAVSDPSSRKWATAATASEPNQKRQIKLGL